MRIANRTKAVLTETETQSENPHGCQTANSVDFPPKNNFFRRGTFFIRNCTSFLFLNSEEKRAQS